MLEPQLDPPDKTEIGAQYRGRQDQMRHRGGHKPEGRWKSRKPHVAVYRLSCNQEKPDQPKARLKAAQTWRWAFIASSTTGTMPRKPWIMPGYSWYSTGTPARRNESA